MLLKVNQNLNVELSTCAYTIHLLLECCFRESVGYLILFITSGFVGFVFIADTFRNQRTSGSGFLEIFSMG
jgi:hypothetical protein